MGPLEGPMADPMTYVLRRVLLGDFLALKRFPPELLKLNSDHLRPNRPRAPRNIVRGNALTQGGWALTSRVGGRPKYMWPAGVCIPVFPKTALAFSELHRG